MKNNKTSTFISLKTQKSDEEEEADEKTTKLTNRRTHHLREAEKKTKVVIL